jgi:hypothetical protein
VTQPTKTSASRQTPWQTWSAIPRRLGSLRLAVCLLPLFAAVLFLGAWVESRHDRETAAELVYRTWWFGLLLGLLGVNIFFAAVKKWPWKRHQTGFLITHVGLLSLVAGGLVDSLFGTAGTFTLIDSGDRVAASYGPHTTDHLIERSAEILRIGRIKRPTEVVEVPFRPGPVPWGSSEPPPQRSDGLTTVLTALARPLGGNWSCDLGNGARLEVVAYHPHVRVRPYGPHAKGRTFPAVQVQLAASQMGLLPPFWVAYHPRGQTTRRGPALIEMLAASSRPEHLEEFFHPPKHEHLGKEGQLVIGLQGKVYRLDVEKARQSEAAVVTPSGITVRLGRYLPNWQDRSGEQRSPTDPAVTFVLQGQVGPPVEVVTTARRAGELDPVRPRGAPVPLLPPDLWAWYHPPDYRYGTNLEDRTIAAVSAWSFAWLVPCAQPLAGGPAAFVAASAETRITARSGAAALRGLLQFAAAADGRLCYRTFRGNDENFVLESTGTVTQGGGWQRAWGAMNFRFEVAEYLPHAGLGPYFEPTAEDNAAAEGQKTAALFCRLTTTAGQHDFWLGRTEEAAAEVQLGGEHFSIGYHPLVRNLGFEVALLQAEETTDPGSSRPSSQSSLVAIHDRGAAAPAVPQEITLNEPLTHNGYKVYQSSLQVVGRDSQGRPIHRVTFMVNRDPGLYLKYAGSILLALGIACMFYMRAYFFRPRPTSGAANKAPSLEIG